MSTSTDATGAIPDISKLAKNVDRLQSEVAGLKAENAQLKDDLAAEKKARDDLQKQRDEAIESASRLAVALDDRVAHLDAPEEREAGDIRTGDVVLYRLKDVVTGDTLEGPGFVTEARDGGLTVSPLSPLPLTLTHEDVQLASFGAED